MYWNFHIHPRHIIIKHSLTKQERSPFALILNACFLPLMSRVHINSKHQFAARPFLEYQICMYNGNKIADVTLFIHKLTGRTTVSFCRYCIFLVHTLPKMKSFNMVIVYQIRLPVRNAIICKKQIFQKHLNSVNIYLQISQKKNGNEKVQQKIKLQIEVNLKFIVTSYRKCAELTPNLDTFRITDTSIAKITDNIQCDTYRTQGTGKQYSMILESLVAIFKKGIG